MPLMSSLFHKGDLTSGSISRNIFQTVLPLWVETVFYSVFWWLDTYWISRLGAESIAAVAVGERGVMFFWAVGMGLANASIAMVGNLVGQKDIKNANRLSGEILGITALTSLTLGVLGYVITPGFLGLMGTSVEVSTLAAGYLRINMACAIVTFPTYIINSILRGSGDLRTPMFIVVGEIIINAILDPLLILGIGVPKMGVNGVAAASVISSAMGTAVGLWVLAKEKSFIAFSVRQPRSYLFRASTLKEVINLVGPNTIDMLCTSIVSLVMVSIIARWGTNALAAYGIGTRLLMLVATPGFDLAVVAAIMMSNNLGAQKLRRAEISTWATTGLNALLMGLGGLILSISANEVIGIFDATAEVVRIGGDYLRLTTPGWLFLAIWTVLRRAFVGAKDVYTPLFISLISLLAVQIPLSLYLPNVANSGVNGVWYAILATTLVQGGISAVLFHAGKWKLKPAKNFRDVADR